MQGSLPPLHVGLIVDSKTTTKYTYEIAEWCQRQGNILVSHLIIQNDKTTRQGKFSKAFDYFRKHGSLFVVAQASFSVLSRLESILLRRNNHHRNHFQAYKLDDIVPQSLYIEPQKSKSGYIYRYSEQDVSKIKSLELDVLIRYGSGILSGSILSAAKFGILSFHHADNEINRGGPPGFWEVLFRQDATGFVIQQLTEELDGGHILVSGKFPTRFHFLLNQAALYKKANFYMKSLLNEIATTRKLPAAKEAHPYFNQLFKKPGLLDQATYTARLVSSLAEKVITRRLLKRKYRWGVAFSRNEWKNLVMWRSSRIPNPPNCSLATPFSITENNRDFCFVEKFDFKAEKACISVYELVGKKPELVGDALVEPFHVSFPYLFRFNGKLYMCPETSGIGEIRLYECVDFPLKWSLSRVLMHDVEAVGTMIFQRDGLWWLFTNIDPSDSGENCSELFIFFSDDPVNGKWTPHPKNPFISDSTKARNGGLLIQQGDYFRIGQKQGFDRYGNGFSINKITTLDKESYIENEICSVAPNFFPSIKGTHHLHGDNGVILFDYLELSRVKN
jgi:hypothetical protein